jgi:uncharacterized membrane protein
MVEVTHVMPETAPIPVRRVPDDRPWHWLAAGWRDLTRAPQVSIAFGVCLALFSWALAYGLWYAEIGYLVLPMAAGFFLIAPLIAVGLYDTSRRLAAGRPVDLGLALMAWHRPVQVAAFGMVLLLLHFAWVRVALLWFALYFSSGTPPLDAIPFYLTEAQNLPFLVIGTLIGGAFALAAFSISVVALPMLLDREVDVITAIITSLRAVRANPRAMALWAGLIVLFTAIGLATFFVGLVLLFPLVAHATWHAYKDVVG